VGRSARAGGGRAPPAAALLERQGQKRETANGTGDPQPSAVPSRTLEGSVTLPAANIRRAGYICSAMIGAYAKTIAVTTSGKTVVVWPEWAYPSKHDARAGGERCCPRYRGLAVFDRLSEALIFIGCNRYSCTVCGKRLQRRLRKYLERVLSDVKALRMWTFTMTNRFAADPQEHYRRFREAWKLFTTNLRRCTALKAEQRRVRFIAVVEAHKSGFWHMHVLVDQYMPYAVLALLWEDAAQTVLGTSEHVASCWVTWLPTRAAVRYIVKYVTKASAVLQRKQKRWTKSRGWLRMSDVFGRSAGQWSLVRVSAVSGELLLKGEATISQLLDADDWKAVEEYENWLRKVRFWATDRSPPDPDPF
jgi:hypothetical protein